MTLPSSDRPYQVYSEADGMRPMESTNVMHFAKAPIVEALIGLEFEETASFEFLTKVGEALSDSYPQVESIFSSQDRSDGEVESGETVVGYFRKTLDALRVVHLLPRRIAFSRLAPYDKWEEFYDEAKRVWELYRGLSGPVPISKFTVRYINRLEMPAGARVEDYLQIYPHIPSELPQTINESFLRLGFPLEKPAQGQLTHQIFQRPSNVDGTVSFVLDNDFSFAGIGLEDPQIWAAIQQCRKLKNDFFTAALTDKMKGLLI